MSFVSHVECTVCGRRHEAGRLLTVCEGCGQMLAVRYDLPRVAAALDRDALRARPSERLPWAFDRVQVRVRVDHAGSDSSGSIHAREERLRRLDPLRRTNLTGPSAIPCESLSLAEGDEHLRRSLR